MIDRLYILEVFIEESLYTMKESEEHKSWSWYSLYYGVGIQL